MTEPIDFALDLMRRLPPSKIEENLAGLIDLVPDLVEDLLSAVDQPLKIAYDSEVKRDYLLCDYNRDQDSYRYSAHTQKARSLLTQRTRISALLAHDIRTPLTSL
jgi:signal transduction histidine kinase